MLGRRRESADRDSHGHRGNRRRARSEQEALAAALRRWRADGGARARHRAAAVSDMRPVPPPAERAAGDLDDLAQEYNDGKDSKHGAAHEER